MASLVFETLASGGITLIEAGTEQASPRLFVSRRPLRLGNGREGRRLDEYHQPARATRPQRHTFRAQRVRSELKVALVKGWQNYLCLHRYQNALQGSGDLFEPEAELQLAAVREWVAAGPEEGSLSELPLVLARPFGRAFAPRATRASGRSAL